MNDAELPAATTGIGRREALKKAAVAGAVVAWGAPVVQTLGTGAAFGQARGSACTGCLPPFHLVNAGSSSGRVRASLQADVQGAAPECNGCAVTAPPSPTLQWTVNSSSNLGSLVPPDTLNSPSPRWSRGTSGALTTANLSLTVTITCGGVPFSCTKTADFTWPGAGGGSLANETDDCAGITCEQ
jgi:hypothetical protein